MRFDVVTIFPEAFAPLGVGLLGKALERGLLDVEVHDLRRWAEPPHRKVDDEPFGGGPGMVMSPGPLVDAVQEVSRDGSRVVIFSAAGRRFDDDLARDFAKESQVVLVCGRYEGIDERVVEATGAEEISLGDFVLTGGEVAALAVIESVARRLPEFMGNDASVVEESFASGLLEYPHYTRPAEFRGRKVPEVLLSGDHGRIARWRREQALRRTFERRPDLLEKAELTEPERALIEKWRSG